MDILSFLTFQVQLGEGEFRDVVPLRYVGQATRDEIRESLTGYVPAQNIEECIEGIEGAIKNPTFDPFQV